MFAQEELQIALLLAVDLLEGGFQPLAEDILSGLARDKFEAVATQREDPLGGRPCRILQRGGRHLEFVGLQARKLLRRIGIALHAGCGSGRSRGIEARGAVKQRDARRGDAPGRLVGQRRPHAQELLRIAGVGSRQRPVTLDRHINGQDRPRLRNPHAIDRLGSPLKGNVWVLCHGAPRKQQGQHQKFAFHRRNGLVQLKNKCSVFFACCQNFR